MKLKFKKKKHPVKLSFFQPGRMNLFKPVKLHTKQSVRKVPLKNLTWQQTGVRFPRMNPFGDKDRDGKLNMFDCRPFDRRRQGPQHRNLTKFSYSTKDIVVNTNPKVKKLLKEVKRPLKVVEVSDIRKENSKREKYYGATDYDSGEIAIDKSMTPEEKFRTIAHEVGHFKAREKGAEFEKNKMIKEQIKTLDLYKELKKDYDQKDIPEETFATFYENIKTTPPKERDIWLNKFKAKHPELYSEFSRVAAKTGDEDDE